ncbi:ABC transporter substrate-binding protein [Pseudonocardia abyssalis]|uniref:ABC transporter substrate-binding protein n=1 Tax=Pseudonocardia abyssalis TaxID=2792008 RepID=A0ABS6UL12_9PSEU|nr:ABC transporter substrate-binding protein [Pseudonocardia abyssalis]MBW0118405.1 ABC transporter substrate-binding protein [Pseudonocardia abyssalis]MBW0132915.1 ABC transporter substrate-binding protein [Pseudonocardia abyssalis]
MRLVPALLAGLVVLSACAAAPAAAPADCVPGSGGRSTVEHAENFSLRYEDGYQVLTVDQPSPGAPPESYVLVGCGAEPDLPPELESAQRIPVPVDSLYSGSTTHLPLLVDLGRVDVLTGVATAGFVSSPEVVAAIDAGAVAEYAPTEQVDVERVVAGRPDVLMTGGFDDPAYATLRQAGIPVVANAEYLEPTPLGRAEWIKVMAALTGDELRATAVFDQVEAAYTGTAALAAGAAPVPVVAGSLFEGVWSVPAGGSYLGRLLDDAGGANPWADDPSASSLTLDFETVYATAGQAPVWLATQDWATRADALAADPRYGELAAMRDGRTWTANRSVGPNGGNDFYERGVTRPDLVLADLVAILHPELLPDHEQAFYTELR